ncbi:MAG: hypothetical protein KGY81_07555 [Phycisphaerae bacterium]|nr:hypothetical protein [Phycisphaerae bacterium]
MKTMYLAASHTLHRGYYLGDVIILVKVATMFAETHPHDYYVLSLMVDDPLNFLWEKFVSDYNVTIIWDDWDRGNKKVQYGHFDRRHLRGCIGEQHFDTYRELYPRLDGSDRQNVLAGGETGLGRANIFEYYYYGQLGWDGFPEPRDSRTFGRGIIEMPPHRPIDRSLVYIAPWEKCQGNGTFTHDFWRSVVYTLLDAGLSVTLNDNRGLMPPGTEDQYDGRLHRVFPPFHELPGIMSRHTCTACGNTGIGWVAGAGEYPLVACESNQMIFPEYSFEKCGVRSLRHVQREPDPAALVEAIRHACAARSTPIATT